MTAEQEQPETTPILHRSIPGRVMEWLFVVLVVAFLVLLLLPTCSHTGGPAKMTMDLSNIRQVLTGMYAYAIDNNGRLPAHVSLAEDYWDGPRVFVSPHDYEASLVFSGAAGQGWYAHGSYWVLSDQRINISDVNNAEAVMLVYRTPREGDGRDLYLVGFLDGHVETLTSEDFAEQMQQQEALLEGLSTDVDLNERYELLMESEG